MTAPGDYEALEIQPGHICLGNYTKYCNNLCY
jgi:hypothetical protein